MRALPTARRIRTSGAMIFAAVGLLVSAFAQVICASSQDVSSATPASPAETQWRGLHIMSPGRDGLPLLKRAIAEKLAPDGGERADHGDQLQLCIPVAPRVKRR